MRKKQKNVRAEVLSAANLAVNGPRDKTYGSPEQNFERIAALWNAHIRNRYGPAPQLDEADVAILLALVKIGRKAASPQHMDSWIDLAGYAACGAEVA